MGLVLAAVWKIIFPAVLCLAKAAMEPIATAETMGEMTTALSDTIHGDTRIAKDLQYISNINSGDNAFTITAVITPSKKSTITTAQENTTDFPRTTMTITVFGNTTTTDRYLTIVNEPVGTIAGGDPTVNKAVPGVFSTDFEEATILQNVINTASEENPYTIYMTTSVPGGATVPNGDPTADTENAIKFKILKTPSSSMTQVDSFSSENSRSTTPLSTENPINIITGKSIPQEQNNSVVMAINFGDAPEDPPNHTQGNSVCYSGCDIIPPWATVLLCLATAFFIFAMVGLLFLLPYCRRFRRPSAVSSNLTPRYSV